MGIEMAMRIHRLSAQPCERYPWNYRMDFGDTELGILWGDIQPWAQRLEVPGVWVGSTFYTNKQGMSIVALRWA